MWATTTDPQFERECETPTIHCVNRQGTVISIEFVKRRR